MGQGSIPSGDAGQAVLDRSRVRILLCDKDPKNPQQVLELLRKCSYQVTAVKTAREVIGVLNSEGLEIDIILAEMDLPKAKGFKMLKHITRQERLRRIPIVMMSAWDEVAIVVKCLKLGAADYLVKPLRINELLNLWIHMWRRRRMLGLSEKNVLNRALNNDLDLLFSDPSESNTNSTTLFSDDTEDKKIRSCAGQETSTLGIHHECESKESPRLELSLRHLSEAPFQAPDLGSLSGRFSSHPKKSKLKVGESSAFLTYVKASVQETKTPNSKSLDEVQASQQRPDIPQQHSPPGFLSTEMDSAEQSHGREPEKTSTQNNIFSSNGNEGDKFAAMSNNSSVPPKLFMGQVPGDCFPMYQLGTQNEGNAHVNVPGVSSIASSQYLPAGMISHSHASSSMHFYRGMLPDAGSHIASGLVPFHALPPCHGMALTTAFPYYPYGLHVTPQLGPSHGWPPMTNVSVSEPKVGQMERREAALNKFRQKRKDRCFDKKIRYVSRKRLAEQRPRIRGQFVRQNNDVEFGTNGMIDDFEDDDEEYGHDSSELGLESSPESLAGDLENTS